MFNTFFFVGALIGVWKYWNIGMENLMLRDYDEDEEHISGNQ